THLFLERGRNKDFGIGAYDRVGRARFSRFRKLALLFFYAEQMIHRKAVLVRERAARIRERDHLHAEVGKKPRGAGARVPRALDGGAERRRIFVLILEKLDE